MIRESHLWGLRSIRERYIWTLGLLLERSRSLAHRNNSGILSKWDVHQENSEDRLQKSPP